MRVLGARRLSNGSDGSTSVERQGDRITGHADAHGHELIALTDDTDISGVISPFDRDDLGPWLRAPKLGEWDALAVTKIDRLSRSLPDFVAFMRWAQQHGKTIISIDEGIDFSTPAGRLIGNILAMFADFERARMAERRADHARKARSEARWDGRSIPPGYRPVKVNSHVELEPDPDAAMKIRRMAQMSIDGKSSVAIAAGTDHLPSTVLSILRNPSLRGYVMHAGQPVREEDGLPVTRTPILDDDTWGRLQAALDRQARPRSGTRSDGSLLLGVLHCGTCGARLYYGTRAEGARYRHPARSKCKGGSFTADRVEKAVEEELLGQVGWMPMTERVIIPGVNHDAEIKRIEESIADLDASFEAGDVPGKAYGRMQAKLEGKLAVLRAVPVTPDRTEYVETGQTYAERWAALDRQERAAFLRRAGVTVHAVRGLEAPAAPWAAGRLGAETVPRVAVVNFGRNGISQAESARLFISLGSLADHRAVVADQPVG